jgi:hypothetical protein
MGYIIDWVIADTSEAQAVADTDYPEEHWPTETFNIGSEYLQFFWPILRGVESDPILDPAETLLFRDDDGISIVRGYKSEFVEQLANLNEEQFRPLAIAFSNLEEMGPSTLDSIEAYLRTICAFAARSIELGKSILERAIV